MRRRRRGDPKAMSERLSLDDLVRFLWKVREDADGHWIWTAHKDSDGYGQFKIGGKAYWAHCVSYVNFKGPIPDGMTVHHSGNCRKPSCIRPDHIELLTVSENAADGNRNRVRKSERNGYPHDEEEPIPA